MNRPIYMDNLATTPVDPRVLDAMLPYFTEHFGNAASSTHGFGWKAAEAVEEARGQVAAAIGASSADEIVFTSGGTESNNLAIKGVYDHLGAAGGHVITCVTEHKSVLDSCARLESRGSRVTRLPVDRAGRINLESLEGAIAADTVLISVMAANNEIGTVQALERIGEIAARHGVIWHCDAVQAVGKIDLDVGKMGVDLLSLSAHKIYGPKGIGALYVRRKRRRGAPAVPRVRLVAQIEGGGHERGIRSGTLNIPGIVGFGRACEIARAEVSAERARLQQQCRRLAEGLADRLPEVGFNGHSSARLPGCLSATFTGCSGSDLITGLRDVAISTGAACSSGTELSHVLTAVGLRPDQVAATIRFGLGRFTSDDEVARVVERVAAEVERNRRRQAGPLLASAGTQVN